MKISIFTTNTSHHSYFVSELKKSSDDIDVICSLKKQQTPKFETSHEFESQTIEYEKELWFSGQTKKLNDFCDPIFTKDINSLEVIKYLETENIDLIIVFGTGKISEEIIVKCPKNTLNLHGGDPQNYRGLDSHLWAIYHKDFKDLKTTIHRLDNFLDNGEIIETKCLKLFQNMQLYMLRAENTKVCIELAKETIKNLKLFGYLKSNPQKTVGRYYSYMPKVLKEICVKNFKNYTKDNF